MKRFVFIFLLAAFLVACSKKDDLEEAADKMAQDTQQKVDDVMSGEAPQKIEDALKRVGDAFSDGEQSVPVGDLKALLPDKLAGLKRTSHDAQRAGIAIKVSKANAEYGEGDKRLSLMITDLGGASGLAAMSRELFEVEVDREDERGFEKTTTYKGHKSFQRMHRSGDQSISEIMVFVDDRFTVQLDGQNVPFKQMKAAIDEIDIDKLAKLKTAAKE